MTDIVERLRAYRMDVDSPDVVYEAADEIERLHERVQAALALHVKALRHRDDSVDWCECGESYPCATARALGVKDGP